MARYSSRQEAADTYGQWYKPQATFMQPKPESEPDFPRTCKKCKEEKAAEEFYTTDKRSYTGWCKTCRKARWEFLKAQKAPSKTTPTIRDVVIICTHVETTRATAQRLDRPELWETYEEWKAKLTKLQEEYTWTARPK